MHEGELDINAALVRRLLRGQFPHWAELPLKSLHSSGTVNALYRLGDEMVIRLPRMDWGVGEIDQELRWLPELAPLLPVEISVPLAKGEPAEGYPWDWGIYPWLAGEHPRAGEIPDADAFTLDLTRFVRALHAVQRAGGPPAGRGSSLARFDESTRAALAELKGKIDTEAATAAWDEALRAPDWLHDAVWIHGDLMPANLLVQDGRLTAVIDWGGFGLGDPAVDLMVAWNLLSASARGAFRAELDVDDATWLRGRGWALWTGLVALPYYEHTNPELADNARYRIREVLADHASGP